MIQRSAARTSPVERTSNQFVERNFRRRVRPDGTPERSGTASGKRRQSYVDWSAAPGECRHEAPPPNVVRLDAALKIVGGRLKPWRQVLDAVRKGQLAAWMEDGSAPIARRIHVLPADIAHHVMRNADDCLLDGAFVSPSMSQVDAMTVLNLRQIDGPLLESAKLLRFDKGRRSLLIKVDEVLAIARGYVATPEAAARIGIGPAAAWHETSHVLGPPQSPAGWPRQRFDDWFASRNPLS